MRELNQDLERRIEERTTELVAANERLQSEVTERIRAEKIQRALFEISEAAHAAEDLPRLGQPRCADGAFFLGQFIDGF